MRQTVSEWRDYIVSLPERVVRSASALAGGLLHEIGEATLPPAVRKSRLYRSMVEAILRFLIEQVGQVEGVFPAEGKLAEDFLLRRTAGNGIELIGVLTFRASPVWVLAALADLSGAGAHVIRDIGESLKKEGLLAADAAPASMEEMLAGLESVAGRTAEAINTPPLDVAELRCEWDAIRREWFALPAHKLIPAERIESIWRRISATAGSAHRSPFDLSSLLALSALTKLPERFVWFGRSTKVAASRAAGLFTEQVLDHYTQTLDSIGRQGLTQWWAAEFRPYLAAAASQFSPGRRAWSERALGGTDSRLSSRGGA
ncbi:MAG TPA: hypothetical protein PKJ41_04770 [Bryobacteraceae bacterium]|nr:hypothetical protein [Bryobacteraceae bacterium]HPT25597.1 hypothetical protein [Bryobacteraceae bacterium]